MGVDNLLARKPPVIIAFGICLEKKCQKKAMNALLAVAVRQYLPCKAERDR